MKKTWKVKVRQLVDLGDCLGVPLNDGTMALVDYADCAAPLRRVRGAQLSSGQPSRSGANVAAIATI